MTYRKKLIEVALPLEAINVASAREKSIRHGHPSTLHLWWARRPLAACRAVLFSSLVTDPDDDPMYRCDPEIAGRERAKLFDLIEELVKWENSNNPDVINRARQEIARSIAAEKVADGELADETPLVAQAPALPDEQARALPAPPPEYTPFDVKHKLASPVQVNHFLVHYAPPVLDPFAGGGSIPLEAQRLGLRAYASDLNPVAVLINKALIEIPPKFANLPPVNPAASKGRLKTKQWHGAQGLADDVRYYGQWMRDEAEKQIGHLYPKAKVTGEMAKDRPDLKQYVGEELTVIAWLWARTVASTDPAMRGKHVPLVRSFWLSKKKGKEAYVLPVIDREKGEYRFTVKVGKPADGFEPEDGLVSRKGGRCLVTGSPMPFPHIRNEGQAGRMGVNLMAIVAEGKRGRVYLDPSSVHEESARSATPEWKPAAELPDNPRDFKTPNYGMRTFGDLFTPRQLTALVTFSDLVGEARERVLADARQAGHLPDDPRPLNQSGLGPQAYADAVATYLGFLVDQLANHQSSLCGWNSPNTQMRCTFARQALPMVWDFAESGVFCESSGSFHNLLERAVKGIAFLSTSTIPGSARQGDVIDDELYHVEIVSTDPPYYDNIGYSDLSDFFYVWMRRSLRTMFPEVLGTMLAPKASELIASPYRHDGSKTVASAFFESGLGTAVGHWRKRGHPGYPTTIFYAFKQSESDASGTASTGWMTFLSGIIKEGFSVTGTWPIRTEKTGRSIGIGTNALASSIVLACVPRPEDAGKVTRRDFLNALKRELPEALRQLQHSSIAPVDLAQAAIGPGMAVFSRYAQVLEPDGSPMTVRQALSLINQTLDEVLTEQEGEFDTDTRFAIKWFEQYKHDPGPFGDANTLANALAIGVNGLQEAGILTAKGGKVQLIPRDDLDEGWDALTDPRLTRWECVQHLIRRLEQQGEPAAAELLASIEQLKGSEFCETLRDLAYRLYNTCERKSWAGEARSYNGLVVNWPEIGQLARELKNAGTQAVQREMFAKE